MSGTDHILFLVEVAAGIVIGFAAWSFLSPMLSGVPTTPAA